MKSIAKGSLLGTFEPIDENINEIQETNWTELRWQDADRRTSNLGKRKAIEKPDRSTYEKVKKRNR